MRERLPPSVRPYENILARQIRSGLAEIDRPGFGLAASSLASGLFIGFGPLLMATLFTHAEIVGNIPYFRFLVAFMYSVGFIFVVLCQTDLYTELDTRGAFPVIAGRASVKGLGRLYGYTIVFNILGGVLSGLIMVHVGTAYGFVEPDAFMKLAEIYTTQSTWNLFLGSILAGWLMGILAWLSVSASGTGSLTFFVVLVTGTIAFLHLPHAIAGNVEVFMGLLVDGPVSVVDWGRFLVASIVGNAIGGVVFVSLVLYGGKPPEAAHDIPDAVGKN